MSQHNHKRKFEICIHIKKIFYVTIIYFTFIETQLALLQTVVYMQYTYISLYRKARLQKIQKFIEIVYEDIINRKRDFKRNLKNHMNDSSFCFVLYKDNIIILIFIMTFNAHYHQYIWFTYTADATKSS